MLSTQNRKRAKKMTTSCLNLTKPEGDLETLFKKLNKKLLNNGS